MKKSVHLISLAVLGVFLGCTPQPSPNGVTLISSIQGNLPNGWKCAVVTEDGNKGHPQGLKEPILRADFTNPNVLFSADRRKGINLNPSINLYFYQIASKPDIMKTIREQALYSYDIPIYFGETEEYIVVTSPSYVNHGVFTEEAKRTIRPMWNVLRKHIECKEDKSIEQLAQPDK